MSTSIDSRNSCAKQSQTVTRRYHQYNYIATEYRRRVVFYGYNPENAELLFNIAFTIILLRKIVMYVIFKYLLYAVFVIISDGGCLLRLHYLSKCVASLSHPNSTWVAIKVYYNVAPNINRHCICIYVPQKHNDNMINVHTFCIKFCNFAL